MVVDLGVGRGRLAAETGSNGCEADEKGVEPGHGWCRGGGARLATGQLVSNSFEFEEIRHVNISSCQLVLSSRRPVSFN